MQRVTIDELARNPVGQFVAGERYAHFCASPTLWGVLLWGRPDAGDALALGQSLIIELDRPAVPHASIVDATRLEGGDARSFRLLERYLAHYAEPLSRQVLRLALVRPPGLGGAVVAGTYEVIARPYPVEVFDDTERAFEWLASDVELGDTPAALAAMLTALYREALNVSPLVVALRARLDRDHQDPSIAEAASALSVSERTLQRRLTEAGTSFSSELAAARVRAAKSMLRDGDLPLTTIALEVGCASLQHFNALFRSRTGESPRSFREKQRKSR